MGHGLLTVPLAASSLCRETVGRAVGGVGRPSPNTECSAVPGPRECGDYEPFRHASIHLAQLGGLGRDRSILYHRFMAVSESTQPDERADDQAAPPVEVLIIDNDEAHAQVVAEGLERVGFACRVATSGTEGAQMIEDGPFDVVITDLVMSDVDGLGILAKAKQESPEAEVILITGHGTVPSAVTAMKQIGRAHV